MSFGADGPAGNDFKFVAPGAALSWLQGLDLASHGSAVDQVTTVNGVLTAVAEDGHSVFTLTANDDGSWSFIAIDGLDAVLRLEGVGIELPLAEIYEGLEDLPE